MTIVNCGCSRDVRLAGKKVRTVTVKAVNLYGLSLDASAAPEQVAFAVMRAVREDIEASHESDREAALQKQFDLCAADEIQRRNRTRLTRDEFVHNVVSHWAPTVAYYARDFETDWERAQARFVRRGPTPTKNADGAMECEIALQVSDPQDDPHAQAAVVVHLAQNSGFWRVLHFSFDPSRKAIASEKGKGKGGDADSGKG